MINSYFTWTNSSGKGCGFCGLMNCRYPVNVRIFLKSEIADKSVFTVGYWIGIVFLHYKWDIPSSTVHRPCILLVGEHMHSRKELLRKTVSVLLCVPLPKWQPAFSSYSCYLTCKLFHLFTSKGVNRNYKNRKLILVELFVKSVAYIPMGWYHHAYCTVKSSPNCRKPSVVK